MTCYAPLAVWAHGAACGAMVALATAGLLCALAIWAHRIEEARGER